MISDIIQYRQEHPMLTLQAIGNNFNVSREYIYKVLKDNNIPTKGVRRKKSRACKFCGGLHHKRNQFCSPECRFKYTHIEVHCAFCHVPFYRTRQIIDKNMRRGYNRIYCSRSCLARGRKDGL